MKLRCLFLGLLLVVLTACVASPTASQIRTQTSTPTPPSTQPDDGQRVENARPTVRPDLEASDPATFRMAAGKLQLVEFFAYW